MTAKLDLRKHGLLMGVAGVAAQAKREGHDTAAKMIGYVLESFQNLTALEISDMLDIIVAAQNKAKALHPSKQAAAFADAISRQAEVGQERRQGEGDGR